MDQDQCKDRTHLHLVLIKVASRLLSVLESSSGGGWGGTPPATQNPADQSTAVYMEEGKVLDRTLCGQLQFTTTAKHH